MKELIGMLKIISLQCTK